MTSQNQNQLEFTYTICDYDDKNYVGSDSFYDLDECVEALKHNLLENPFKKTWKAEIWINGGEEIADRKKLECFHMSREFTAFEVDDEDYEWEYHNYGTEPTPLFGEISYRVAGGGMMNGNAYATIELKDGIYYYCEYGKNPSRREVGSKIIWSPEIYDKKNPYECRSFDIE